MSASTAGKAAEATILRAMQSYLTPTTYAHKAWVKADCPAPAIVLRVPFVSIYGTTRSKTEFLLVDPLHYATRIEVKWQVKKGSVDEKFPYVLANATQAWPEPQIFIVTGGKGAKPGAITWLTEAAKAASGPAKTIRVFTTTDDFVAWCHHEADRWARLARETGDES